MARHNYYGMEDDDVGGLDFDELGKADVNPVDDAGEDSETRDVSDATTKETAHNEAASAGGIVVGDNAADLTIDPVGATEAMIRTMIGLSREDLEEVEEQLEAAPDSSALTEGEVTDEVDNLTTVNVVAPAGATAEVADPGDVVPEPDTPAAVAGVEFLYRIQSREDDMEGEGTSDVEFDVKTPNNDVNFEMEGKAVTIEPNSDGDMGGDEPASATEEPAASEEPPAEEEPAAPEGGENEEPAPEGRTPEGSEESWFNFF